MKTADFPSVLWPLIKCYKFTLLSGVLYKFIFDMLQFVSPQLLSLLITFIQARQSESRQIFKFQDRSQPLWIGVTIALLMFLAAAFQSMVSSFPMRRVVCVCSDPSSVFPRNVPTWHECSIRSHGGCLRQDLETVEFGPQEQDHGRDRQLDVR